MRPCAKKKLLGSCDISSAHDCPLARPALRCGQETLDAPFLQPRLLRTLVQVAVTLLPWGKLGPQHPPLHKWPLALPLVAAQAIKMSSDRHERIIPMKNSTEL